MESNGLLELRELVDKLTRKDIEKLHLALAVPDSVSDKECEGISFLFALKGWSGFDRSLFHQSLSSIRPDLVRLALRISWLCVSCDQRYKIDRLHPYNEQTLDLIRRQLFRIRPGEYFRLMANLDEHVLNGLSMIGSRAYQDLVSGEIMNDNKSSLQVGKVASWSLSLMQEHLVKMGIVTNELFSESFSCLTIQELTAAIWLSRTSSWDQHLTARFMVNTDDLFLLFRNVLRCVSGLLTNQPSKPTYTLFFKYLLPSPVCFYDLPKCVQLRFDSFEFFEIAGWDKFREKLIQLCTLVFELKNDSVCDFIQECKSFLPNPISLYLSSSISADQWTYFLYFWQILDDIDIILIYFDTNYFTPTQLFNLLESLRGCSVKHIAIKLEWEDHSSILAYTNVFRSVQLPSDTRVSFELTGCVLTEPEVFEALFSCSAYSSQTLSLHCKEFSSQSLNVVVNQLYSCENLRYYYVDIPQLEILLPAFSSATRITGLHLYYIPIEYHEQLFSMLSGLSRIRELAWVTEDDGYALLPHITHLSTLSYLQIRTYSQLADLELRDGTLQVIESNRYTIRGLVMYRLMEVGIFYMNALVGVLQYCCSLMQLELQNTHVICDDVTLWYSLVSNLRALAYLKFYSLSLGDSGMLHLCRGLLFHPAIRGLVIQFCRLSSNSCNPLINLIPTLSQLEILKVNELSTPDSRHIKLLTQTADQYTIQHFFSFV